MSEKVVVKVLRPLDDPAAPWMVYDSGRRHLQLLDPPSAEIAGAVGASPKAYFDAIWTGDRFVLGRRIKDQAW